MIKSMLRNAIALRAEELLRTLGLERRRRAIDHVMIATPYFFAGAIVGSCVALLLAPTAGSALRDRLREAGVRAKRAAGEMRERAVNGGRYEGADNAS